MGKSNKPVIALLPVIEECCVRNRKVNMEENCYYESDEDKQKDNFKTRKPKFSRSESVDSGVFMTPPSSPIHSPLTHFPPSLMFGQHGASLAGSFVFEQEMGLCKLKLE